MISALDEEEYAAIDEVDITAIETDERWDALDHVSTSRDVTGFRSIRGMVDGVTDAAGGDAIGNLRIIDHASPGSQEVGDEWLNSAALADTEENAETLAAMSELRDQFGPNGSLELKGCRVGAGDEGEQLLRDLARVLEVPATGATRLQTPFLPGLGGRA